MGFMEDDFNKTAKRMVVFGVLAWIVQVVIVISAIIGVLFVVKHLFF